MIFQTLDEKQECVGIYYGDELIFNQPLPENLSHTWSYSAFLADLDVEYAKLYCGSQTLDDVCPESLKDQWDDVKERLLAFHKSLRTAKIDLSQNCFYDLVPQRFLIEYCYVRNLITDWVFQNFEKPKNYDYMLDLTREIDRIKHTKLKINLKELNMAKRSHRDFSKKIQKTKPYCHFNINGTRTGRLTTTKTSFPILTFKHEYRSILKPNNDFFVELDFNAAEIRTLLSLQNKPQPQEDIHEWNIKNVFSGKETREEAKQRIFAWLYNPESTDYACEKAYDRKNILTKYFSGDKIINAFGTEIESEKRTALNYIIQSTCAENVLRQMIKVSKALQGSKSYVAFPIHDSIVIDFSMEDGDKLKELVKIFSQTELGDFKVNIRAGKDFGSLKDIEV